MSAHEMFSTIGFTCFRDDDKVTYTKADRTWIFNLSQRIVQSLHYQSILRVYSRKKQFLLNLMNYLLKILRLKKT